MYKIIIGTFILFIGADLITVGLSDKKSRRAVGVVGMGLCIGLIASTYI